MSRDELEAIKGRARAVALVPGIHPRWVCDMHKDVSALVAEVERLQRDESNSVALARKRAAWRDQIQRDFRIVRERAEKAEAEVERLRGQIDAAGLCQKCGTPITPYSSQVSGDLKGVVHYPRCP